jgi:hypothetical protein
MRPRPSSARGWISPNLRRPQSVLLLLLTFALALAACGSSTVTGSPAEPSLSASPEGITTTPASPSPAAETPSDAPSPSGTALPSASPFPSPSGTAGSARAGAAACSGSAANRDFYASMAAAVDWVVYCPVLADGWFVHSGQYRKADGGRLEIVYQGPDRAQITLDEGAFCTISGGCVPPGIDVGATAFGDRDGTLVALDDGSWAVAVDREATLSWLLVVTGLDETATRAIAAQLVAVED